MRDSLKLPPYGGDSSVKDITSLSLEACGWACGCGIPRDPGRHILQIQNVWILKVYLPIKIHLHLPLHLHLHLHRPTHLLESHVSGQMLKKEETEEGEAQSDTFHHYTNSPIHSFTISPLVNHQFTFTPFTMFLLSRGGDSLLPREHGLWYRDRRIPGLLPGLHSSFDICNTFSKTNIHIIVWCVDSNSEVLKWFEVQARLSLFHQRKCDHHSRASSSAPFGRQGLKPLMFLWWLVTTFLCKIRTWDA